MIVDVVIIEAARAHAAAEYPRESCGLVVISNGQQLYVPCRNVAVGTEHCILSGEDRAAVEDEHGDLVAFVHSHPNASPKPSQADVAACEDSGIPWLIVSWNPGCGGDAPTSATFFMEPAGERIPYVGRQFSHGVLDCYAIVRDWYRWEYGIVLENFRREDDWWEGDQNLYVDNFAGQGFSAMPDGPRVGDVLLMHILSRADKPNHAGIYLGEDKILHHLHGRLSMREVYGSYYRRHTTHVLRHESRQ